MDKQIHESARYEVAQPTTQTWAPGRSLVMLMRLRQLLAGAFSRNSKRLGYETSLIKQWSSPEATQCLVTL